MTFVSAGHIILTPTQPVGSGRPQRVIAQLYIAKVTDKARVLSDQLLLFLENCCDRYSTDVETLFDCKTHVGGRS